jgi:lipopolysaccharide transport system ATP-binding protein
MSKPIIEVEHLSKCYRIGATRESYLSLRDELARKTRRISSAFSRAFRKGQTDPSGSETDFWALNDVSFSVPEGEAVGIIGRNGAGKSTLLKILSQITPPTKGQITMRGRVASLLEVGTGFHPELTGRENIYLNGAILGMTRVEIRKKFDEIVAFSEVEKFLDTPVKRYSSGMYVRLAFAVAAHLEPEILIVDEVLAVGDAAFQKKCLGKMKEVGKEGRTVLFVSHNMGVLKNICSIGVVLDKGAIIYKGLLGEAVRSYTENKISSLHYIAQVELEKPFYREVLLYQGGVNVFTVAINKTFTIRCKIEKHNRKNLVSGLIVKNSENLWVIHTSNEFSSKLLEDFGAEINIEFPAYTLGAGKYSVDVTLFERNYEFYEYLEDVLVFEVEYNGIDYYRPDGTKWKGVCGPGLVKYY